MSILLNLPGELKFVIVVAIGAAIGVAIAVAANLLNLPSYVGGFGAGIAGALIGGFLKRKLQF